VSQRDFRIGLYRRVVPPGYVRFNVRNYGEDTHDLAVLTARGTKVAASGEVRPGARLTLPGCRARAPRAESSRTIRA
jgi:hypothetical protein